MAVDGLDGDAAVDLPEPGQVPGHVLGDGAPVAEDVDHVRGARDVHQTAQFAQDRLGHRGVGFVALRRRRVSLRLGRGGLFGDVVGFRVVLSLANSDF